MDEATQFLLMLEAIIRDAAQEGNATQIQTTYTPPGEQFSKVLRVTIVPEQLDKAMLPPKIKLGQQDRFLQELIDAFQEVSTKRNHLGNGIIRQVMCTVIPSTTKVRFIVAPEEMDMKLNQHIDPRVGD